MKFQDTRIKILKKKNPKTFQREQNFLKHVIYQGSGVNMALKFSKQILKPEHSEEVSSKFWQEIISNLGLYPPRS